MDPRLYRHVYAQLKKRIADGTLPPETRLNIGGICEEYNVGRETAQKAIRLLADDGLIERWPGLGWYVKEAPASG